ncbi:MAG: 3-phosphoshikimate 1-carboxyvinyltransferase, partial [Lentisphaerae bacterium]|nr:3-phosphoshikimate 1-carboxyvinyltransferase [Lentisphaerota bacterium]
MRTWCVSQAGRMAGSVRVPGDKSISHRAAMLGALARGVTELDGFLASEDCLNTLGAVSALGAKVERSGTRVSITGT